VFHAKQLPHLLHIQFGHLKFFPDLGAESAGTSRPLGLGRSPQDLAAIVQEARDPKTIAEKAVPLAEHGGDRKSEEIQVDNINLKSTGGTSSEYLTARIARDNPAILEKMKAGEYPSVRAAARAAGVLKETSPLDLLKRAWGKASQEERDTFLVWVKG
jgi:hypothetical protein